MNVVEDIKTQVYIVNEEQRRKEWRECKVEKIENSKVFQNPKKIEFIMLILFLIPGTPKDLLVYVAGLLPIKPLKFIIISTFARFPSVITSTLAGENVAKR